jgi:hypothetical protein
MPGHPVDDDLAHGDARFVQGVQGVAGLGDGERLRQQDPGEGGARGVAQQLAHLAPFLLDFGDQLVGQVRLPDAAGTAAEALGQDAVPLPEPAVEGALHVQLGREQGAAAGGESQRLGGQGSRESVAQGVGRIGGDDEDAMAGFGGGEGGRGGAGGLAYAPLAAEETEGGEGYGSSSSIFSSSSP